MLMTYLGAATDANSGCTSSVLVRKLPRPNWVTQRILPLFDVEGDHVLRARLARSAVGRGDRGPSIRDRRVNVGLWTPWERLTLRDNEPFVASEVRQISRVI
jgi:hypothetical protein